MSTVFRTALKIVVGLRRSAAIEIGKKKKIFSGMMIPSGQNMFSKIVLVTVMF